MLILFIAFFFAALTFFMVFLLYLPDDIKKQSIRPLFLIAVTLAFWIFTMPAYLAPELQNTVASPAYNILISGSTTANVQLPAYITTAATSTVPISLYNAYFVPWLAILTIMAFMLLLWFLLLLRTRAMEAMHSGADVMEQMDRSLKRRK